MQSMNSGYGKRMRDEHLCLPSCDLSSNFEHSGLCNEGSKLFSLRRNKPEPNTKRNEVHTAATSSATNGAGELHRNVPPGIVVDDAEPLYATDRLSYGSINGATLKCDLRSQKHQIGSEGNIHESVKPPQHVQPMFVNTPLLCEKYPESLKIEHQDDLFRKNDLKRKLTSHDCSGEMLHKGKKALKDSTSHSRVDGNNHSNDNNGNTSQQAPSMNAKRNQNLTVITSQLPNKKHVGVSTFLVTAIVEMICIV